MSDIKPGKASLMAVNLIVDTDAGITATSQATGATSKPQKEGSGAAGAFLSGTFNGTNNLDYYIEIESTGEIGTATFKWSDDGGATFDATGVGTSTSPVTLNNGVQIFWTQGAGDDVVAGDNWRFKAYLPYHRNKLLDRDRDTEWRSSSAAGQTLTFDLGAAQTPRALVLLDHNLQAGASVRLQGASDSGFASIVADYAVPYQSGSILYFLGDPLASAQYWRVQLSDPSNPDGYLRLSEVFLGDYTRLSRTFSLGDLRGKLRMGQRSQMLSGKYYGAVNAVVHAFDLSWVRLSQTDRDLLVDVFDALNDLENRQVLPVFFSPMSTDLSQIYLCEWSDQQVVATGETDAPERFTVPVRLVEQARTLDTVS
jgi:hypothetical protein